MKSKKPFRSILIILTLATLAFGCGRKSNNGSPADPVLPPPIAINSSTGSALYKGKLLINNPEVYKEYLRDNINCDPPGLYVTLGTNAWDCSNYSALSVSIYLEDVTMPAYGRAEIYSYLRGTYLQLPPSVIAGNFHYIDKNSGIELLTRGQDFTPTYNAIFRYKIKGLPEKSNTLPLEIYYRSSLMATASLTRTNSTN